MSQIATAIPPLDEQSFSPQTLEHASLGLKHYRAMPDLLVAIRHGESLANVINRAIKKGEREDYPDGFRELPDREVPLSERGIAQAKKTGTQLGEKFPTGFDIIYVSDHRRAKETAAYICIAAGWKDVLIRKEPLIGERNWGNFPLATKEERTRILGLRTRDPLHAAMPDGETILDTRLRSREFLDRCARQFGGQRVLIFSHGEYIEALWAEIAHMDTERQIDFFHSPAGDIKNCQIVEFSSKPFGDQKSESTGKLEWVRSSCPQADVEGNWTKIEKPACTAQDLMDEILGYPEITFSMRA